ncbi:hypothetical protein EWM64_g5532, partial [Hericium alpestre]
MHPSLNAIRVSSSRATTSDVADPSSRTPSPASSSAQATASSLHDPHKLPSFDSTSLTSPSQPILYLPPLLSSLPPKYPPHVHAPSSTRAPKTTQTHLPDIDPASLALHKALHNFGPVTERYAHAPYAEAFNWDELELPEDEEREWYCVAFRSIRKAGSEAGPLYEADKLAHEEAIQNGGLIMYWYGIPDAETGLNLATCIWQSRAHAIAA